MVRNGASLLVVAGLAVVLTGCVVVREEDQGRTKEVNISTPVGALAAKTGRDSGETGLPVYPGAQPSREKGDTERANVSIGTPWFGLHVRAAEYESGDAPEKVLAFYREELKTFGAVTECRGDVNFKNGQPVCRQQAFEDDVQLLVGTEDRHRIVSVKPRRGGTEFALVSIQTGTK
jgi:hypothetical protein